MVPGLKQETLSRLSISSIEADFSAFLARVRGRPWGSLDSCSLHRQSLDNIYIVPSYGTYFPNRESEGLDVRAQGEGKGGAELANGRSSVGSLTFDCSPRNSDDSQDKRFEAMARNSLSSLQQRRPSTASAFIREPLAAATDDRNWSWSYLRERFRVKDLEDLFDQYQLRLHHAMLIVYLILQVFLSFTFIVALFTSKQSMEELVPEFTGHVANLVVCLSLLLYVYNEHTFRQFPRLHIVMSGLVILTLFATDVALTLYFQENSDQPYDIKFGNMVYLLLVVYVFLPIPKKWQVLLLAALLTAGDLALSYYAIASDHLEEYQYVVSKMCVDAACLLCVNLLGLYWRFMSEVAFRRAFLDKRGNLESKFKVEAEKKQEENLLLSVLPKNIMQQVKADFRNMIERTIFNTNPITKSNPFPNLYINHHEMVSILYADIVNFTPLTTRLSVDQLVEMLNDLFGKFDDAAEDNDCLRIKILGDCYYCVSGVPEYTKDHAHNCVKVGLAMIDIIRDVREMRSVNVDMRIGIHSGSVLSGLIGVRKWQFDVWSNDVTIANHMEQTGAAGRIHVTHKTQALITDLDYGFELSNAKERDQLLREEEIETYFLTFPKQMRKQKPRKISYLPPASVQTRVTMSNDPAQLRNLYEGDVSRRVTKVQLPPGVSRSSILNRRRSTHSESAFANKRRTVVTDNALTNFQKIMVNSKESMEKAIEAMPLRKYDQWFKPEGINPFLLTFTKRKWELPLLRQADPLFKYYILCAIIVFIFIFATQEALMPSNSAGWVSGAGCLTLLGVVAPLVWVATVHQHIVDPYNDLEYEPDKRFAITNFFYWASKSVISSVGVRVAIYLAVCVALYVCAVINVLECKDLLHGAINSNSSSNHTAIPLLCCDPWYFTYSATLTLLAAWTFFRMHFLLKFAVYIIAVSVYGYFSLDFAQVMYNHEQLGGVCPSLVVTSHGLSPGLGHLFFVIMIFLALHMMDRQMEYIMRLDFQWKQQLEMEQKEAETTHYANKLLLENILPLHVADRYLNRQNATDELYHESFKNVSVIFASIPNYSKFYREHLYDEDGKKCLRILNEIISDFDMLTYEEPFRSMEKIKVVGSTYMAACGLQPDRRNSDESAIEERSKEENVAIITKFAAAMFEKLETFNHEGFQELQLRVGIDVGPVIAGVVGAHKPMYDIWSNTVNVASRMDYTGEMGTIHVTSQVGEMLQKQGWSVTCRGEIEVKGKGYMVTYFVDPKSVPNEPPPLPVSYNSSGNNNNNNNRKSSQELSGERRRSSQLSLTSLKGFLSSHRGSLDISINKDDDSNSTRSLPIYKPIITHNEKADWRKEDFKSLESTPRSSIDSKDSGVVKGSPRPSYPSPVAEEGEWTPGVNTPQDEVDPNKTTELMSRMTSVVPNTLNKADINGTSTAAALPSCKGHNQRDSSAELSSERGAPSPQDRDKFIHGVSRESPKLKHSESSKDKRSGQCPDVRQGEHYPLSSPHSSITIDSDETESVRL